MSPTDRSVLLFSGQGSNQHLVNPQIVQGLLDLLNQENRDFFERFLRSCIDAFHVEFANATPDEQRLLGHDLLQALDEPESLFIPPQQFQSHPIIETLSLYIHQILELILFQTLQNGHRVVEVAGVCTGTLPAILAACFTSFASDDFVAAAVQGFRLAFWIGVRATENVSNTEASDDTEATCVLGIFGSTLEALQELLQSHPLGKHVQISAVFSDNNISISGPSTALHHIKAAVAEQSVQSRWAHVHAIYHGGRHMESTLQATLADAERRNIDFPSWDSLHVPLRSVSTGTRMNSQTHINSVSLLETTLRSIFIEKVDWKLAASQLYDFHQAILERDSAAKTRVIGIGPGSKALGHSTKDLCPHPRLDRIDSWSEHISHAADDDIAIVGLSVNYPGANGVDQLWELLQSGRSMVSEIPSSRFTMPQNSRSDSKRPKFTAKYGNFLQNPFDFDAAYFNISPREAKSIDPQQRLLLHAALEALEDAGYRPDSTPTFQTETFGVYAGVATGDYVDNLRNDVDVYYSPGTLRAFLSGRISYAFKFKGPSIVIDTACSSSTVALYEACKALRSGDCTAALAMGVNTMTSPDMYSGLGRAHFLSPTGQCKPFDEGADGYCRAEGCGGVVVKKLSDAIAEGDYIYGVIRGIGVNQCGTAKSITHPDSSTQAALMKTVLHAARVSPRSISVIEAHGTGTQAGDHAECSSLRSVFGSRPSTNPLYLGSVKGSFGHAEAASGIAGLAKLLTMMQKKKIPPQSSHNTLNPALKNLVDGSLHISRQLQDWSRAPGQPPRRALLNNFGAAGSNAALILEEYIPPRSNTSTSAAQKSRSHQLLTVTAKTEKALESLRASYASYLRQNPDISLDDFCYSANSRRQEHFPHRFSTTATDRTDIIRRLTEPKQPNSVRDSQASKRQKKTIFVFSGQGGAHAGMGADLLATSPDFATTVHKFDKVLCQHGFAAVAPYLTGAPDSVSTLSAEQSLVVSQCALFVLEFGLASLWLSWGVSPDLIMGHSIGEYAAFAIAKVLDPIAALLLVAKRARLMARLCKTQSTGMLACRISAAAVTDILSTGEDEFSGLSVACMNSAQDLVLAGPLTSLDAFAAHCKTQGAKHKLLQVPFGFHSQAMDPILDDLSSLTSETPMDTPSVTLGSSLYGRVFSAEERPASNYFVDHARESVRFADLATDVANQFAGDEITILEIGPSPSTDAMFKSAFANNSYSFVTSLKPSQPSWATLTQAMHSLFLRNYSLNWRAVYRGVSVLFQQSLPKYPLDKAPYFVPFRSPVIKTLDATDPPAADPRLFKYAFLSKVASSGTSDDTTTFTTDSQQIGSFVKAHCVGGVPLCPASVYLEVVLQAAAHQNATGTDIGISVFDDVVFEHPYVFSEDSSIQTTSLQTRMGSVEADRAVQFRSSSGGDMVHCTGSVRCLTKPSQNTTDLFRRKMLQVERLKHSLDTEPTALMQKFSPRTIYNLIFPRVVKYSDPFLTLQHLTLSGSGLDGKAVFRLSSLDAGSNGSYVASPAFVDTLLHAAGFIANTHVTPDIACICVSIEQAVVCCDASKLYNQDLRLYCTVGDLDHSFIADAYAIGPDGSMLAYVSGMCFKKIRLKSFEAHLSRAVGRSGGRKASAATPAVHRRSAEATRPQRPTSKSSNAVVEDMLSDQEDNTTLCILAQVCGLDQDPAMDHTLEQLGVDSLLMIELMELLQQEFSNLSFDSNDLENCRTVGDLMNLTAKASGGRNATRVPSLVHTRTPSPTAPEEYISTPPESRNDHAEAIRSIFIDVCGLDPEEGRDQELSLLGVDSLMSIELLEELSERLGIKVDMKDYNISDLTYQQLELLCEQNQGIAKSSQDYSRIEPTALQTADSFAVSDKSTSKPDDTVEGCVKLLQSSNAGSPSLYMFHDGSGLCSMYSKLHNIDQQLYGVYSLESPSSSPRNVSQKTVEDLAAWYIKHANLLTQSQEVVLGGWSFGGVLAFEVSRQLARHGKPVKGLILVDSPVPINHQALPEPIVSFILAKGDSPTTSRVVQEARARIRDQFLTHAAMLQKYSPAPMQGNSPPCVFVRCVQTMDTERLCGTSYPWLNDVEANKASILQWEKLLGRAIPVLEVDCNHFGAFDASAIEMISKQLQKACSLLQ